MCKAFSKAGKVIVLQCFTIRPNCKIIDYVRMPAQYVLRPKNAKS